jgi:hypothetical protein
MDTEQARDTLAAIDNYDRAVANLRNAAAMAADDTRATLMLEEAGEMYGVASAKLVAARQAAVAAANPSFGLTPAAAEQADDTAAIQAKVDAARAGKTRDPGIALYIVKDGHGAGFVAPERPDWADQDRTVIRLTTDATFRGQDYPAGQDVAIPEDCLSDTPPEAASTTKAPDPSKGAAKA